MQFKTLILVVALAMLISACGGSETPNNTRNANTANSNGNAPAATTNTGLDTKKVETTTATNNAPTLGPVVVAYYEALKKKDAAATRKLMSAEYLKETEDKMKQEKQSDLIVYLTEFDELPEGKMETRNEEINGARGTVQVNGGVYNGWPRLVLVNEGGSWKMTNEVP